MKFNFDVSGTEFEGGCDPADDPNGVCHGLRCTWGSGVVSRLIKGGTRDSIWDIGISNLLTKSS